MADRPLQSETGGRKSGSLSLEGEIDALKARAALSAAREMALGITLEHIDQGILMVDAGGTIVVHNGRVSEMLDLPEGFLAKRPTFLELLHYQWETAEFIRTDERLKEFVRAGGISAVPNRYERERPNGMTLEVRTQLLPGGAMVRTFTDITARKQAQATIERAALYDDLTGLPSRLALQRRLETRLAEQPIDRLQLFYLSLDRFRLLNDARGHEFGDKVLVDVAQRLSRACDPMDFISRVGGDEFAILHQQPFWSDGCESLSDRLLRTLAEPQMIDGGKLSITASIGVITADADSTAAAMLRNADIAMNRAKDAGRNQASHHTPSMTAARQDRFHLEQSLREAIGTDAFSLAYQPIVAVDCGTVVGYEALLRWTDRVRGDVLPAKFIPIAEATGLIVPLGRSVLEWACFEAASWGTERTIAVNLSPAQLKGDDIVEAVRNVLQRSGLAPERLELEVTEGMLLENTRSVSDTMTALDALGVKLTLDDFGAGHAGLSYLRRFPFKKMKIDGSFVRTLGRDPESDAIIEAILLLGRRLNMSVVAECVETTAQLEQLKAMECPYVQGYLTGEPMTPERARLL